MADSSHRKILRRQSQWLFRPKPSMQDSTPCIQLSRHESEALVMRSMLSKVSSCDRTQRQRWHARGRDASACVSQQRLSPTKLYCNECGAGEGGERVWKAALAVRRLGSPQAGQGRRSGVSSCPQKSNGRLCLRRLVASDLAGPWDSSVRI